MCLWVKLVHAALAPATVIRTEMVTRMLGGTLHTGNTIGRGVAGEWECARCGFASDPQWPCSSKLHRCDGLSSHAVALRQHALICWVATCLIAPCLDCNGLTV